MTSEIALRGEFLPKMVWQQIEEVSARLIKSGALPSTIDNGSKLTMVLLAGYEAGMKPMESLNAYYIVNGRLTIYGDALMRQLKRGGYKVKWGEVNPTTATVTISKDGEEHTETYTMKDAETAGHTTGKNAHSYKRFPTDQLRWKCIARAIRFFCPEVLGGVQYLKEEAEDFVEASVTAVSTESSEMVTTEQKAQIMSYCVLFATTMEEMNGWSMGQFQRSVDDLTFTQATKAIETLAKKAELQGLLKKGEKPFDATEITVGEISTESIMKKNPNEQEGDDKVNTEPLPIIQADLEITDEDIAPLVKKDA